MRTVPPSSYTALLIATLSLVTVLPLAIVPVQQHQHQQPHQHGEDLSWREYLEDVYGHYHYNYPLINTTNITEDVADVVKKSDINFYYKNAHVKIVPLDWPRSYIKTSAGHLKDFILSYNPSITYDSYSWVEVSRFSSTYLWSNFREGEEYFLFCCVATSASHCPLVLMSISQAMSPHTGRTTTHRCLRGRLTMAAGSTCLKVAASTLTWAVPR